MYNAADKDLTEIHDWERIEIIIRNVSGVPGGGSEAVSSSTVTLHKEHHMRRPADGEMQFLRTATGNHLLVWQADESNLDGGPVGGFLLNGLQAPPHGHELHFVTTSSATIAAQLQTPTAAAEVRISDEVGDPTSPKNVHYVFVPERSSATIAVAGAQPLNGDSARYLASRVDNGNRVSWAQTKRIIYELQDLADITAGQWTGNTNSITHWTDSERIDVLLESPIVNESGVAEVPVGRQTFRSRSRDSVKGEDGRDGYITKSWLYGSYSAELNPEGKSSSDDFAGFAGLGVDSLGRTRGVASGRPESRGQYWWQHDFFVHDGVINSATLAESGQWLAGDWYTAARGGFDGRWVQLFNDAPSPGVVTSLNVSLRPTSLRCSESGRISASVYGGTAPYRYVWSDVSSSVGSTAFVETGIFATVTVTDAAGTSRSAGYTWSPYCRPGEQIP